MTELIIDNVHVVLSSDFAVTVKQENPFITKNGEYTYDCTLSLTNPINANLYSFLQRINKREAFATNRRVILIADNRVYCDGTEVITKWTDDKVTIQIVSGNSQLNYFIGSDKKISDLDLGSAVISEATIKQALYDSETLGYAFPFAKVGGSMVNLLDAEYQNNKTMLVHDFYRDTYTYRAMPFLNTILVKMITALGYTIKSNMLTSSEYRHMLLLHGVDTTEFAKMLPGWTCKEFLEEVEKLFNIVFYINYKTKQVDIVTQSKYYQTAGMVHIVNVKDSYETDVDKDATEGEHTTSNIGYGFADTEFFNLRRLPKSVITMSTKKSMTATDFKTYIQTKTDWNMMLDTDPNTNFQFIGRTVKLNDQSSEHNELMQVNQFPNKIQDDTSDDIGIELNIMPTNMAETSINFTAPEIAPMYYFIPVIDEVATVETTTHASITEWVTSGDYNKSNSSKSSLYVGLYYGPLKNSYWDAPALQNRYAPLVYTWLPYRDDVYLKSDYSTQKLSIDMSIDKIATEFYGSSYVIDRKKKYTVESYDPNIYDPRQIFEIRNKRFVCESIEYTIDAQGRKGAWKGIFYPVNVSDVDAEHLWILADGRWRNNGVWLNNGRWLDK